MFSKLKSFATIVFCLCISIFACSCGYDDPSKSYSTNPNSEVSKKLACIAICAGDANLTKFDAERLVSQSIKYSNNNQLFSTSPHVTFVAHKNYFLNDNLNEIYSNAKKIISIESLENNKFKLDAKIEVPFELDKFFTLLITSNNNVLTIKCLDEIKIDTPRVFEIENDIETNLKSISITISYNVSTI